MDLNYNQGIAETIVVSGIGILVVGAFLVMYWQTIMAGALGLTCLLVLMNHKDGGMSVAQAQQSNGIIVSSEHDTYVHDCMKSTEYIKEQCELAWKDRGIEKEKPHEQ